MAAALLRGSIFSPKEFFGIGAAFHWILPWGPVSGGWSHSALWVSLAWGTCRNTLEWNLFLSIVPARPALVGVWCSVRHLLSRLCLPMRPQLRLGRKPSCP